MEIDLRTQINIKEKIKMNEERKLKIVFGIILFISLIMSFMGMSQKTQINELRTEINILETEINQLKK